MSIEMKILSESNPRTFVEWILSETNKNGTLKAVMKTVLSTHVLNLKNAVQWGFSGSYFGQSTQHCRLMWRITCLAQQLNDTRQSHVAPLHEILSQHLTISHRNHFSRKRKLVRCENLNGTVLKTEHVGLKN